jgi:hypothetical protein
METPLIKQTILLTVPHTFIQTMPMQNQHMDQGGQMAMFHYEHRTIAPKVNFMFHTAQNAEQ